MGASRAARYPGLQFFFRGERTCANFANFLILGTVSYSQISFQDLGARSRHIRGGLHLELSVMISHTMKFYWRLMFNNFFQELIVRAILLFVFW